MAKISLEELENAGRLAIVSIADYQVVKYRAPLGRSGNFYIRVFQNGTICKNTAASLQKVANQLKHTDLYSDNYNTFGDNIIQYVMQLEKEEVARQRKLRESQLQAAKETAALTQQTAIKILQHPHISSENKRLLQTQISKLSQSNTIESIKAEKQSLETLLSKIENENQAAQEKAEAAEKVRQAEIARQKAEKIRQDKLDLDIEGLYHNYQRSQAEDKEVETLKGSLQVLQEHNHVEHKKSLQAMISMLVVLVVGVFVGGNVSANQQELKEARTNLVKVEKKLQKSEKGYVSEKTQNKIHDELSDTKKIHDQKNRKAILAETKRLSELDGTARSENKAVNLSVQKLKSLSQAKLTSTADQKALVTLTEQKDDYEALKPYQKQVSQLLTLVTAHNLRTSQLQTYQSLLGNQDLSKDNKNRLTVDIKNLEAAKTADDITNLATQLDTDGKSSQAQANKSKAARELNGAKQKAQADLSKAQSLLGNSYISSSDKSLLQNDIDSINQAKNATEVADLQAQLTQDNAKVEKNNAAAQKAAEDKAAADEAAKQKAEADAAAKAAADAQAAQAAQAAQNDSADVGSTTSDGWVAAPAGQVYCKAESMRYYAYVKNPGNFMLMSIGDAQAAGYTPGHGNGSAKN